MKNIYALLFAAIAITTLVGCSESENEPDGQEYNFHLTIELIENDPCGYEGQRSEDKVEMTVNIKGDIVTITDIQNYNHTINPVDLSIVGDCSVTCAPAGAGPFNVTSVNGQVNDDVDTPVFTLELHHSDCKTPSILLECPGIDPIESPTQTFEYDEVYSFVLKDSLQIQNSPGLYGLFVRLEPK